ARSTRSGPRPTTSSCPRPSSPPSRPSRSSASRSRTLSDGKGLLIKRRGALVVVSAPSGAGKTTLCHEGRAPLPSRLYAVSYTTRAPRPGEANGVDFHFTSEPEFVAMRDRDEFAEWAVVHGHLYGTPARQLEQALARGEDVLLDIDTQGARQ